MPPIQKIYSDRGCVSMQKWQNLNILINLGVVCTSSKLPNIIFVAFMKIKFVYQLKEIFPKFVYIMTINKIKGT